MRALLTAVDASFWSQISAVVFGLMFVCVVFWVFIPSRRKVYQRACKLPLED